MHWRRHRKGDFRTAAICAVLAPWLCVAVSAQEVALLSDVHATHLSLQTSTGSIFDAGSNASRITQMAWGPGPDPDRAYLYISSERQGVRQLEYDATTGTLSLLENVFPDIRGQGIGFHLDSDGLWGMYACENYASANDGGIQLARLWRHIDADGDGLFGGPGDAGEVIAHGIPRNRDHSLNQIQFSGDTLFVGSGVRTQNGALEDLILDPGPGESAYGGAILFIEDVNQVGDGENAAGFPVYLSDPTLEEFSAIVSGATAGSEAPYTSEASDKLRVHSSGTRNPFGLAVDDSGQLWFTNNFHRTTNSNYDRSVLDESADVDALDGETNDDIHDQLFVAAEKADYGYRNGNWQQSPLAQAAGFFSAVGAPDRIHPTHMFDNLDQDGEGGPDFDSLDPAYNAFFDPGNPVGLGPHTVVTGLDFVRPGWPERYQNRLIVALFRERALLLVDRSTGAAELLASFQQPTDVLADDLGNLLVANWGGGIWHLAPRPAPVPALSPGSRGLLAALLGVFWLLRRQRRAPRRCGRPG